MAETPDFPQLLERLLHERGMTQLELAARVGVTRAAMSRYISGDREPRFVTLVRIAEELGVRVEELLPAAGDPIESAIRIVARAPLSAEQRDQLQKIIDARRVE